MAQDIVSGLFGIQQAPDYAAQDYRNAMALAELNNPNAQGRFLGAMVGAPLGRALGKGVGSLLGVEDPRLKQQKVIASAKQMGFKVDTVEGLQQLASYFIEQGEPGLAQQVAAQALQNRQTTAQVMKSEEDLQRGQQYRAAVAQLQKNPNATEQDYINLARQFSGPEAGMTAAINAQSREALALEKADIKREEKEAKTEKARQAALSNIGTILDTLETAIPQVGPLSAGLGGAIMGSIWGTTARDLKANVDTIVANLGFQQLQAMRDASPTGGALGQVAVKELEALQSTVANLKQDQSPKQMRENLEKVKRHYLAWKKTLEGGAITQTPQAPTAAPVVDNDPLGIRTRK